MSNTQLVRSFISFLNEPENCEFCIVPSTRSIPAAAHPLPASHYPLATPNNKSASRQSTMSVHANKNQMYGALGEMKETGISTTYRSTNVPHHSTHRCHRSQAGYVSIIHPHHHRSGNSGTILSMFATSRHQHNVYIEPYENRCIPDCTPRRPWIHCSS